MDVSFGIFSGAGFSESAKRNKRRRASDAKSLDGNSVPGNSAGSWISLNAKMTRIKSDS